MEQNESLKPVVNESPSEIGILAPSSSGHKPMIPSQQSQAGSCPTCRRSGASTPPSYVYTICQLKPYFPDIGLEKEFAQATGRVATAGLTDRQAFYETLKQNRYLVPQLCWVASIKAVDTYILVLDHPSLEEALIETANPNSSPADIVNVVIGMRGPIAPPEMCNGLMVPLLLPATIYTFTRGDLLTAIPRPENVSEVQFKASAEQLFDTVMQMVDNNGTGKYRAPNYLAVRDRLIYQVTYNAFQQNKALNKLELVPSSLSGTRKIDTVILHFTDRRTNVTEKYAADVDTSKLYPYLVSPFSPYIER